jgi:hypothetical protein
VDIASTSAFEKPSFDETSANTSLTCNHSRTCWMSTLPMNRTFALKPSCPTRSYENDSLRPIPHEDEQRFGEVTDYLRQRSD